MARYLYLKGLYIAVILTAVFLGFEVYTHMEADVYPGYGFMLALGMGVLCLISLMFSKDDREINHGLFLVVAAFWPVLLCAYLPTIIMTAPGDGSHPPGMGTVGIWSVAAIVQTYGFGRLMFGRRVLPAGFWETVRPDAYSRLVYRLAGLYLLGEGLMIFIYLSGNYSALYAQYQIPIYIAYLGIIIAQFVLLAFLIMLLGYAFTRFRKKLEAFDKKHVAYVLLVFIMVRFLVVVFGFLSFAQDAWEADGTFAALSQFSLGQRASSWGYIISLFVIFAVLLHTGYNSWKRGRVITLQNFFPETGKALRLK